VVGEVQAGGVSGLVVVELIVVAWQTRPGAAAAHDHFASLRERSRRGMDGSRWFRSSARRKTEDALFSGF
jgi:hypothetical protein